MKAKRLVIGGVLAASVILFAFPSRGQSVPQLINYQGKLANASGQPLDGVTVDLAFAFYDVETGDSPLLTASQPGVLVTGGIYSVLIGSGPVTPGTENTLYDVFKNHSDVWMGVKVNSDQEMSPRARISTVGYAFRSGVADMVAPGGVTAASLGENCAIGQGLVKTFSGWSCGVPGSSDLWAWLGGDATYYYGIKNVTDPANLPPKRTEASSVILAGSKLMFGGFGQGGGSGIYTYFNDLWWWDGVSWTWLSGNSIYDTISGDNRGVYGIQGVADPANYPGGRHGAASWTHSTNQLYVFGGEGFGGSYFHGYLNDLWKWDWSNWTWVSGNTVVNQYGTYGDKGVAAPSNVPGGRYGSASWIDSSGNLWVFGGYGCSASTTYCYLNDLWKWDGTEWTWINGDTTCSPIGNYGTKGVRSTNNVPGSRQDAVSWIDTSSNIWLFGGRGRDATGTVGDLNDLWRWDVNGAWTWISGSSVVNTVGTYGTLGVPDPANIPGGRYGAVSWMDTTGRMWLLGGRGFASTASEGYLNDLWVWDGSIWTWISGSNLKNQVGVHGNAGVASHDYYPGGRYGAIEWLDSSGNPLIFGGFVYKSSSNQSWSNDLWKYYP